MRVGITEQRLSDRDPDTGRLMRVEITEQRLSDKDPDTGRLYVQVAGDVITVPDALGLRWCGLGWAQDVDGQVATGPRRVQGAVIDVQSGQHTATSPEVSDG